MTKLILDRKKFRELQKKTESYPFHATSSINERIDPRQVDSAMGVPFIRLPDFKGNNVWYFKSKRDRDWFVRMHKGAKSI